MEEYNKYLHIKSGPKNIEYYMYTGAQTGYYELYDRLFIKLLNARSTDRNFKSSAYVWLIGERTKYLNPDVSEFAGIKICWVKGDGIKLYKEV